MNRAGTATADALPPPGRPLVWGLAVLGLTLLWPALQPLVFGLRVGRLPPGGAADALVFLPLGLVAAGGLVLLLRRARSRTQAVCTLVGYAVAVPLAFVGALAGGLLLPGAVGTLVGGTLPLAVGAVLGFLAGAAERRRPRAPGADPHRVRRSSAWGRVPLQRCDREDTRRRPPGSPDGGELPPSAPDWDAIAWELGRHGAGTGTLSRGNPIW